MTQPGTFPLAPSPNGTRPGPPSEVDTPQGHTPRYLPQDLPPLSPRPTSTASAPPGPGTTPPGPPGPPTDLGRPGATEGTAPDVGETVTSAGPGRLSAGCAKPLGGRQAKWCSNSCKKKGAREAQGTTTSAPRRADRRTRHGRSEFSEPVQAVGPDLPIPAPREPVGADVTSTGLVQALEASGFRVSLVVSLEFGGRRWQLVEQG